MYLKIAMNKDRFQILKQDNRECMTKTATNGIEIRICSLPELRTRDRCLFLRGDVCSCDYKWIDIDDSHEDFTNYLRALEEVVDRFVICLR